MTRRMALAAVAAMVGTLRGSAQGRAMYVPLDGLDVIVLRYRGEEAVVPVSEIMAALRPSYPPQMRQMPGGK